MRYEIVLAPEAVEGLRSLPASIRTAVGDGIEEHLRDTPTNTSGTHIKRLRGFRRPQYRLRVEDRGIYYDVTENAVAVLAIAPKPEAAVGLSEPENRMKQVAVSDVKDDLSHYLHMAEEEEIIITRHGKPAGVLVGFKSEDDWLEYRLEHDPLFLQRIERARHSLRSGQRGRPESLAGDGQAS